MTGARIHTAKSWTHFFQAIKAGAKTHDLRYDTDRNFRVGDFILLEEYDNINGDYLTGTLWVEVTYITSRGTPCAFSSSALDREYVILSIRKVDGPSPDAIPA